MMSVSEFVRISLQEFYEELVEPWASDWLMDASYPDLMSEEIDEWAEEIVETNCGEPPEMGPIGPVDNSQGIAVLIVGIASLIIGLFMTTVLGVLGFLGALTSIFWFMMAKVSWVSEKSAYENAVAQHEFRVRSWETLKAESIPLVAEALRLELHKEIRKISGVPHRLEDQFVQVSKQHSEDYRSGWIDEIERWANQPEFPPSPSVQASRIEHEDYEHYCRDYLVSWGYLNAKTTRYSRDGGIDVESAELVVQCKHYSGMVGVKEVREIFGIASHARKTAVVFSAGDFTKDAKSFGKQAGVALFILDETRGPAKPVNEHAVAIIERHKSIS